MNRLKDKVALVCGAATGIGAATVRRFADEGALVLACGLPTPEDFDNNRVSVLRCDVTDDTQVKAVVATTLRLHGRIDILVNAAGIVFNDEVGNIADAEWARMYDINVSGTMRSMRAVLAQMVAQGAGSIVNIASVAAFNAGGAQASYAASKAAVVSLTRSAAQTYGPKGVRINALCPGWVDTPMSQREMQELAQEWQVTAEEARQRTVARVALGRMATAAEMAACCLFLASDDASFVNGAALVADGGARVPAASRAT